jgi:lysine 2,3-aminomutase
MNDNESENTTGRAALKGPERALKGSAGEVSPLEITHSSHLRKCDPEIYHELESDWDIETIRKRLFSILIDREVGLYSVSCDLDDLERSNALNCIKILKNLISTRNERLSGHSILRTMLDIVRERPGTIEESSRAAYADFLYIALGSLGRSNIYREENLALPNFEGREGAIVRSDYLDELAKKCMNRISSYRSGLEADVVDRRAKNRQRILDRLGASMDDWKDYRWHQAHVFRDAESIGRIVSLSADEITAIDLANANRMPFGITPYYLSLFDEDASRKLDHAIRAQVIPPLSYVKSILSSRRAGTVLDFMKEGQTSPVDLVTRRYPMIAILKPFNACAQICVYCQRNWEIGHVSDPQALAPPESISRALDWFRDHPMVTEVLVTGGDPALMEDDVMVDLLTRLSAIDHISRIRIGTRLPVVLPMRFTDKLVEAIGRFHSPPDKDLCVVTHFEHTYEVTPEAVQAVQKLRMHGIAVYNQQVFTIENSRKFETAALRLLLKQIGVDPYYTFNTKGKEETVWYRVPIARLLQERKEEARVLPGLSRTDEPVFNIPALGKNHLRAWQHHDVIMISPKGERIYEFHPWEKNITNAPTYVYADVPILDYMMRIRDRGEDIDEYRSIWYYF